MKEKKDMIYIVGQKHGAHDGRDSKGNLTSMMCHDCFKKCFKK